MRRVIGLVLGGLGAFFIAAALLTRFYVAAQVLKFPLNEYHVTTLQGDNATYFSPVKLTDLSGITMRVTDTIEGDVEAGSSTRAVWNEFTYLYDVTNGTPYQYTSRRQAFGRRSGELVNCCGAFVGSNANTAVRQSGLAAVWPYGAKKETYMVFDYTLDKPTAFHYAGTDTVEGTTAYRYVANVPPQQFTTQTLPAALVGLAGILGQSPVTLPEFYQANDTYWVDPATGAILNANEDLKITLQDTSGVQRLVLIQGNLNMTPQSIHDSVKADAPERTRVQLLTAIIPLLAGLLGIALLGIGVVLTLTAREPAQPYADAGDERLDSVDVWATAPRAYRPPRPSDLGHGRHAWEDARHDSDAPR
jgi:hypothetical protein